MKIKLPAFIETYIVKFALSKSGPFLQKGISLLAAYLVAVLSQKVPGLEQHLNVAVVTGIIWTVVDSLLNLLPSDIIKRYGRDIQSSLVAAGKPVVVDGLALSKTTEAAIAVIDKNKVITPVKQSQKTKQAVSNKKPVKKIKNLGNPKIR